MHDPEILKMTTPKLVRVCRRYVKKLRPIMLEVVAKGDEQFPMIVQMDAGHRERVEILQERGVDFMAPNAGRK